MFTVTIKNIYAVNKINTQKQVTYQRKNRECCALSVKKEGTTLYRTQKATYQSDPSNILLLKKGISYEVEFRELGECIMIEFDADFMGVDDEIEIFKLSNNAVILDCLEKMERSWTFKQIAYRSNCLSLLYRIFYILERTKSAKYLPSEKFQIIKPAVHYLEEKYSDNRLTVEDLAKQANISPSYFRRIFSSIYMMSPTQYLRNIRIGKAKELLLTDGISVTDVAEMVGFSNVYYFDTVFKKETGMAPTEYTMMCRSGFTP